MYLQQLIAPYTPFTEHTFDTPLHMYSKLRISRTCNLSEVMLHVFGVATSEQLCRGKVGSTGVPIGSTSVSTNMSVPPIPKTLAWF